MSDTGGWVESTNFGGWYPDESPVWTESGGSGGWEGTGPETSSSREVGVLRSDDVK